MATKKRTLDSFFQPSSKKAKSEDHTKQSHENVVEDEAPPLDHPTYPFPVARLPQSIASSLTRCPPVKGKVINNQPDLDLLYFQPYIPRNAERELFESLRRQLFFYRVEYNIKRGGVETHIRTPRYTTVFGVDESSKFSSTGELVDAASSKPVPKDRYKTCTPRPIPHYLDELRKHVEAHTSHCFNFCLVNYYAAGADSISYHSDDERFLGPNPTIASFSLGASRDFLMKHKPPPPSSSSAASSKCSQTSAPTPSGTDGAAIGTAPIQPFSTSAPSAQPLKFPLASGDMILMRGRTQSQWLHSIPKRKDGGGGRINITFRKALVRSGTENYYCYNVGSGGVFRWDETAGEMKPWVKR